jgi:hypothetical protein
MRARPKLERRPATRPARLPECLPDDVTHDGVFWDPTWEEIRIEWHKKNIQIATSHAAKLAAQVQAEWLQAQTRRLAAIAQELDDERRRTALIEAQELQDAWWLETAAREKASTEALMAAYQKLLDGDRAS